MIHAGSIVSGRGTLLNDGIIRFHNLHLPNEVRVFQIPGANIRVWNDEVMVYEVKIDDPTGGRTFRHYSFYDQWFEINITLDASGKLITEPGPIDWSFNCDICAPCFIKGTDFYNVDLELDVLVGNDGHNFIVIDEDDFEKAVSQGLITENERDGAQKGLVGLTELIASGKLTEYLNGICSFTDIIGLSEPLPYKKLQLSDVPLLSELKRERYYGRKA